MKRCFVLLNLATSIILSQPRPEHPRPDWVRPAWQTLNGAWEFEYDDANKGMTEKWYTGNHKFSRTIQVPFCFQAKLSGIGETNFHDTVWYRRRFSLPNGFAGKRTLLRFEAVDYESTVWVNGEQAGRHRGGHVGFFFDITDLLKAGSENTIVVRAWDPSRDRSIPRGKQYWMEKSQGIFYTRTTGIWQSVWLEAVGPTHLERARITPDVDNAEVSVEPLVKGDLAAGLKLRAAVRFANNVVATAETEVSDTRPLIRMRIPNQQTWSPERPNLYDLTLELVAANGQIVDSVATYFGQRKVHVHNNRVYLNNAPYYLKMVLDQGYWPDGLLTAPTDEALQYDIKMTKAFGFNGARKHQKVEDARWLYWCDKMGLIAWGEMANAYAPYHEDYVSRFVGEWQEAIARDYNHPSIIAWVPINESWGVMGILTSAAQQAHAKSLYWLTKSLDQTRLVIDNDGWEHTDATDLMTLHDYARTGEQMAAKYEHLKTDRADLPRNGREALAFGYKYNGTPILMTEFGGISYRVGAQKADNEWGYSGIEPSKDALLSRLNGLVKALRANNAIVGYCYTQLTDVEQEINGLMTYDRKPKAEPAEFAKIFEQ